MFRWDHLENLGSIDGNDGWRRESGGPQGRIFLCRQYLSSLCPVVNRLPFLPRRGGSSSPPWTVKGDRSSAPSSPFVANEPCVFMRFAIRLPDPDYVAPVHLSLIGIYNFINVKFDSDLEREEREIPTRSRPIIVVIVGRETTIYTWEKGEGARNEWNGWDGWRRGKETIVERMDPLARN